MRRGRAFLGAVGVLVVAGCSEQPTLDPGNSGGSTPLRVSVQCTANVVTRELACDPVTRLRATSGGRLIMGGQGTYLLLASSGTTYDGDSVFQTNVTLQNRSAQPMGSSDGNFADGQGIRVFFIAAPTTTSGTGVVTVTNPDSVMDNSAPGQATFIYQALLRGGQTSAAKNWRFDVPNTVLTFSFQVQVSVQIPELTGVLRWRQDGARLNGISCSSAAFCFAVGDVGTIRAWNGTTWTWSGTGTTVDLSAVSVVSTSAAMAVGPNGTALRWNGAYWKALTTGVTTNLNGVWCSTATECFLVGDGGLVFRWNGTTFTSLPILFTDDLHAVWGTSGTDVYVGGDQGLLLHWNGTVWQDTGIETVAVLTGIWGSGPTDVYVVGHDDPFAVGTFGQIWHGSGTSFIAQTNPTTADLNGVGGLAANNVFAVGANGTVLRNTTGTWTDVTGTVAATQTLTGASGGGTNFFLVGAGGTIISSVNSGGLFTKTASGTDNNLNGVWGTGVSDVYAVGDSGTILHWNGTKDTLITSGTTQKLNGIWGSGATNIFAVGNAGLVLRSVNGTVWTPTTATTANLRAVWGSGATDIYAVGDTGVVLHSVNGTVWTPVAGVDATMGGVKRNINAVWGTASNDVYAVGDTGLILHWNGATWAKQPYQTGFPLNRDLHGIWGTGPTDIWAVAKHTVVLHNDGEINSLVHYIPGDTVSGYTGPWDHVEIDGTLDNASVFGGGAGNVFSVGDSGMVLHQNNADLSTGGTGLHWSRMNDLALDRKLRGVWVTGTTDVFIVGDRGLFFRGVR